MSLHHMLRAAAGYQAPAPATTDPQFNYVSLLLHGDGTNGAQNNTFIDSSTNNFTITRNGNTTQGSLSPYGNLWSNWFNGSGSDWLTVGGGMPSGQGTEFTLEFWAYATTAKEHAFTQGTTAGTLDFSVNASGAVYVADTGVVTIATSANGAFPYRSWVHIALTRTAGNLYTIYINGVSVGTGTNSTSMTANTTIGKHRGSGSRYFQGYLSNWRVSNTLVYTSNFTPPTAPLMAISGTSLLTCQSNRFVDNSANNFTITRTGDVRVTKESPFLPTAAYSTSTIGGSGYFDGNGDFLQTPTATALNFNSVDYTVEAWVYLDMSTYTSFDLGGRGIASDFLVNINNGRWLLYVDTAGKLAAAEQNAGGVSSVTVTDSQNMPLQQWVHVAICKSGTTLYLFKNGALVGTATSAVRTTFGGRINVGQLTVDTNYRGYFQGFISNVRLVKGTALYTSNFTPSTTPLTAVSGTSLLLNFTNAGIFDNAAENNLETVGNAQISTSVKKYGTGSIAFDGTGDWLLVPDGVNLRMGTGNFTVEAWVYLSATGSARGLVGKGTSTTGWLLSTNSSDQVVFTYGSTTLTSSSALSANTWTHVAVVREGTGTNQTKIYIGGSLVATGTVATDFNQTNPMYIGADRTGGSALNGYIDDLRITKGFARYTAAFTPPTAAFPDQ